MNQPLSGATKDGGFWEISAPAMPWREPPYLRGPWLARGDVGHSSGPAGRYRGAPVPLEPQLCVQALEPIQTAKSLENMDFLENP